MNDIKSGKPIDQNRAMRLVQDILKLHESDDPDCDCDCESCSEQMDNLAELVTIGHDADKLLPTVKAHLECCPDCREEFEALLCIIRREQAAQNAASETPIN